MLANVYVHVYDGIYLTRNILTALKVTVIFTATATATITLLLLIQLLPRLKCLLLST